MAITPQTLDGQFVAEVKSYNVTTRELEVFIPKLMPGIPEGRKDIEILTNLGNKSIVTKYRDKITLSSTITARAIDTEEPLPTVGSKVFVEFIDEYPQYCFWSKFNMNFDYDVIPEEKYARQFYLKVGDKQIAVHRDDLIKIEFDTDYDIVLLNDKPKEKRFRIIPATNSMSSISTLERLIGKKKGVKTSTNIFGETSQQLTDGEGILKEIEDLKERVNMLAEALVEYHPIEKNGVLNPENFNNKEDT